MKKKILLAVIGLLMFAIFMTGGSQLETITKNNIQFASFAGIALCVYLIMKHKDTDTDTDTGTDDSVE